MDIESSLYLLGPLALAFGEWTRMRDPSIYLANRLLYLMGFSAEKLALTGY